ncbi:malonyl-CoA O-methyltransferase [Cetobacterium ceti]|uniref:Malonyl-CoA O-methyltransferase n=1 Tax=Cetobacterium ceti TaxID=180163 RepID=A0A1T4KTR0_9FUSO|nr:methyltransferase domain-containing protein [Cetobacterium ceti]SJZ45819.1 malonyl-CoA O-methyltransferase [Cetobacterium ceti]
MKFDKNFKTYDNQAQVQKSVAKNLIELIDKKFYKNILELGCGTGIFTKLLKENLTYDSLDLNDYFDSREYFTDIPFNNFFVGDMSTLNFEKYSLICSSSAIQWIENMDLLFSKISKATDEFIFSIYIKENLQEIKNHFNISLNYKNSEEIFNLLKKYFKDVTYSEETFNLNFSTPLDALKHLKKTGVTGLGKSSISLIKSYKETTLTYKVAYFICKN